MSFLLTCHAPRLFRSTWIVRALVALVLIIISGVGSLVAQAAPPEIRDIYPRGLQSGGTTRLVVQGEHLDEGTRLVLPVQPPERVRVVKASPTHLELEVTLSEHVDANLYPLRVANTKGISSAVAIGVDRLPQRAFAARIDSLPIALHGTLAGDQVLVTQFVGLEGQELVIDVEGQRLGSALRPVIRLLSADGRQVAMARPLAALAGDTRLSVKLPTSGEYRIELHDAVYQGPAPGWFRMKIGSLLYANRVYPHAASNLGVSEIEYLGSNLPSKGAIGPSLTATPGALSRPVPWPQGSPVVAQSLSNGVFTGSQPKLAISEFGPAEWTEQQVKSSRPTLLPPLGINGRLERPHEQDSYTFDVLPGSRLRVALEAASFGSPLDGILDVFAGELDAAGKPTGGSLGHADDQSGSADPMLDVQVPADVQKISVRISSLIAEGGPEYDYRLSVQAVDAIPPLLTIDANRINVPAGGQVVAPVRIQHVGMKRPLRLQLSTPTGSPLTIADTVVDPEEDLALVQFSVGNPNTRAVFLERVLAVAEDWSLERPGILAASALPGSKYQSDWRHDLAIAVTEPAPLSLELGTFPDEEQVMDVQPSHWLRGARQPLAVRIQRPPGGHTGPVRLSLISSQTPPTKSENNQTVPDTPRIWRILENVVAPAGSSEATLTLVTPVDLPLRNWSLAVQGELLSDDGQTVLAIVHSPVVRRPTQDPLTLTSSPPLKVSIAAGDEAVLTIEGQITRNVENGLPVEVRLEGLPAELSAIQVTVASDQRDWQLPIQFPNNVKPQEIKEVRIVARYANADDTWRDVVSSTQPFALEIAAPPQ